MRLPIWLKKYYNRFGDDRAVIFLLNQEFLFILLKLQGDFFMLKINEVKTMFIGQILKHNQPDIYNKLKDKYGLRFNDYKRMMEEGHAYKRTKGGAYRQVR
jgi:hypothetical protein